MGVILRCKCDKTFTKMSNLLSHVLTNCTWSIRCSHCLDQYTSYTYWVQQRDFHGNEIHLDIEFEWKLDHEILIPEDHGLNEAGLSQDVVQKYKEDISNKISMVRYTFVF